MKTRVASLLQQSFIKLNTTNRENQEEEEQDDYRIDQVRNCGKQCCQEHLGLMKNYLSHLQGPN
jgi:hypothetical protein